MMWKEYSSDGMSRQEWMRQATRVSGIKKDVGRTQTKVQLCDPQKLLTKTTNQKLQNLMSKNPTSLTKTRSTSRIPALHTKAP